MASDTELKILKRLDGLEARISALEPVKLEDVVKQGLPEAPPFKENNEKWGEEMNKNLIPPETDETKPDLPDKEIKDGETDKVQS